MSAEEPGSIRDGGAGSSTSSVGSADRIQPTIKDDDGNEVTPVYTETLRARTKNDNVTHQSLCGDTEVEAIGEEEWHVTIEGMVLLDQLQTLFDMRPASSKLTIIGDARTHRNVDFDRFVYEQKDEHNTGQFSIGGRDVEQPLFTFQLQSKDDQQG